MTPSTLSAAAAASDGVATDGAPAALNDRSESTSCGSGSFKTPGRVRGGGSFCRRSTLFLS